MELSSPCFSRLLPATAEVIRLVVHALPELDEDPFAILSGDSEFLQTLYTPAGYILEWQDGCEERHYRAIRKLTADEVTAPSYDSPHRNPLGKKGWSSIVSIRNRGNPFTR